MDGAQQGATAGPPAVGARLSLVTVLLIAVVSALLAVAVAAFLQRRKRAPLEAPANWHVPPTLRREDFERPDAPWLVVAFTSSTCDSCAAAWQRVSPLGSEQVAVEEVEARAKRRLHERYRIDAVPLVVVADAEGAVRAQFLGPFTATDLWGALAELRHPGSVPPGCAPGGST